MAQASRKDKTMHLVNHLIIDTAQEGIAVGDLQGLLTYVNRSFCTIWECDTPESMIGKDSRSFWGDAGEAQKVIDNIMNHGFWIGHLEAVTFKGNRKKLLVSARMLYDGESPIALSASFLDITQQESYKQVLFSGEEAFTFLYSFVPAILVVADEYFTITMVSNYALQRLDRKKTDVLGRSFFDFLAPQSRSILSAQMQNPDFFSKAEGERYSILKQDETELHIEILGVSIKSFSPGKYSYIIVAKDLSETEELETTINLLRQGIEQTSEMFVLTNREREIIYANKACREITGYDTDELLGENVKVIASENTEPATFRELNNTLARGGNLERGVCKPPEGWISLLGGSHHLSGYRPVQRGGEPLLQGGQGYQPPEGSGKQPAPGRIGAAARPAQPPERYHLPAQNPPGKRGKPDGGSENHSFGDPQIGVQHAQPPGEPVPGYQN